MTRSIQGTTLSLIALLLLLVQVGCDDDPAESDRIVAGEGLVVEGDWIRLDTPATDGTDSLGSPTLVRDLGPRGRRLIYEDRGVTLFVNGEDDRLAGLHVDAASTLRTEDGLGPGSQRDDVESLLGEGWLDPFTGRLWFRRRGVAFTLSEGEVTAVHLFRPVD